MDDRMRISDADRERVTARLRDHFAEGRLTPEEFDERITTALNAKTAGDLRRVMADLPESVPLTVVPRPAASRGLPSRPLRRRPRFAPLALFAALASLLIFGRGSPLLAFLGTALLLFLAFAVAGIILASRLRRRLRRVRWSLQARDGYNRWACPRRGHDIWTCYARCGRACWAGYARLGQDA